MYCHIRHLGFVFLKKHTNFLGHMGSILTKRRKLWNFCQSVSIIGQAAISNSLMKQKSYETWRTTQHVCQVWVRRSSGRWEKDWNVKRLYLCRQWMNNDCHEKPNKIVQKYNVAQIIFYKPFKWTFCKSFNYAFKWKIISKWTFFSIYFWFIQSRTFKN